MLVVGARGKMQKISAGKFQLEPPSRFTSFDHLVGAITSKPTRVVLHGPASDGTRKHYQPIKMVYLCSSASLCFERIGHSRPDPSTV
jgi:hypothetical protein